MGKMKY